MTNKPETNTPQFMKQLENWGYLCLPKAHPASPGCTGLLVAVRESPTKRHFDPEEVCLEVLDENGRASRTRFHLESHFSRSKRVCPTVVTLRDRLEKEVEFFTFGGWLDSASAPEETVYSLRSPAPILKLENPASVPARLAAESEALLAKIRTKWGAKDDEFARQLCHLDPLLLYAAVVSSTLAHYQEEPALRREDPHLYATLQEEARWLKEIGHDPARTPALEALLSPQE